MPTEFLANGDLSAGSLQRIEASFEALNARIARLAIGLGVPLDHEQHIQAVLSSPHPLSNADPQHTRHWTELRGLLVLRYGMEKNYAEQFGADTLRQILTDAEEHLSLEGFKPGADGLQVTQLFGKA